MEFILPRKWSSKFPEPTCLNTQTLLYAFQGKVIYQTPTYMEKFLSRLNRPSCLLSPRQLQWTEGAARFKASWKHSQLPHELSPTGLRQARSFSCHPRQGTCRRSQLRQVSPENLGVIITSLHIQANVAVSDSKYKKKLSPSFYLIQQVWNILMI